MIILDRSLQACCDGLCAAERVRISRVQQMVYVKLDDRCSLFSDTNRERDICLFNDKVFGDSQRHKFN